MVQTWIYSLAQYTYTHGGYDGSDGFYGYGSGASAAGAGGYDDWTMLGILLIVLTGVLGMFVQQRMMKHMRQFSSIPAPLSGAQTANLMLSQNGITDVRVTHTRGTLTDHFNPMDKTVNLSDTVYSQNTVAAMAVAAHECGHAVQHARSYAWIGLRSQLVPVVNLGSRLGQVVLIIGLVLAAGGGDPTIAWVGLALFGTTTLFALVTLPVEFDASRRALDWLQRSGLADRAMHGQAATALRWAAMTYVAAALSSIAMLLYYAFIILANSRQNRR